MAPITPAVPPTPVTVVCEARLSASMSRRSWSAIQAIRGTTCALRIRPTTTLPPSSLLYLRPRVHALHEGFDIREGREVEFDARCPTRHRVKIGIRDRELVTHQVLLTFEHLVDVLVLVRERLLGNLLV